MEAQVQTLEEKSEQALIQIYAQKLKNERIFLYAESLEIPFDDLDAWSKSSPIPGEFIYSLAHKWQRYMTYPFEDVSFEKFKSASIFCNFAGNKGGKTVWIVNWPLMECMGIHPLQKIGVRPKPPVHWWFVSPNLPSESEIPRGEDAPIIKKFYEWCPDMQMGSSFGIKKFYRKDKIMTIMSKDKQESIINFKSHDQEKGKFKSEDVDGIANDEEPPKPLFDEEKPRILTKKGIILLGMTSDYASWTWQLLKFRNDPEYWMCEMDSLENPFMPVEHRKKILSTMTDDELLMRRFGKHIQFKGKVFPFDYHRNVGKPFVPSRETTNYIIIDWHPAKPIVITYLAINPRNIWYVFKESVVEQHVVELVAKEYNKQITFPDYRLPIKKNIIDKIAQIEQAQDKGYKAKSIVDMLRDQGIRCEIGLTDFNSGQAFLSRKLNHSELFFDPSCRLHIEQWDTWGAKRYQKGNMEGTLRDQLELEGNDTCINLVYAFNAGAKFYDTSENVFEFPMARRPATERIYGRR